MNAGIRCNQPICVLIAAVLSFCLPGVSSGEDCMELCKQGRELLAKKDYEKAEAIYSQAVRLSPKENMPHMGLALAYRGLKKYKDAIGECDAGLKRDPEAGSFYALKADLYAKQNNLDAALENYTNALEHNPHDPDLYLERAKIYLAQKKYDDARIGFTNALENEEKGKANVWALASRARIYFEQGDLENAKTDFESAAKLESRFASHYFWRALIAYDRRHFEEAVKLCSAALDCDHEFSPAFGLRGLANHYLDDDNAALKDFDDAISNNHADPIALLWRGRLYYDKEKFNKALDDFAEVLALTESLKADETRILVFRERAKIHDKQQKSDLAKQDRKAADDLEAKLSVHENAERPPFMDRLRIKMPGFYDPKLNKLTETVPYRPAPDQIMLVEAKTVAEKLRPSAQDLHGLVEKVAVASLLPEPCTAAQKTLQQAKECFERKEYELASLSYRSTVTQCDKLLDDYEKLLGRSPEIWLKWAREKADRVQDPKIVWAFWLTLADVERLFGNREEQHRALKKALDKAGNVAFSNPQEAAVGLTALTRTLLGQGDKETARETLHEAASICENLNQPIPAAYYNAVCAGLFARLGDTAGWQKHFEIARRRSTASDRDDVKNHADLTAARAYAFADEPQKAFGLAQDFERQKCSNRSRPDVASFMAITYAQIAFAEARLHRKDHERTALFDKAYVATCTQLASFDYSQNNDARFARGILALADAEIGAFDRAAIGALTTEDPSKQTELLGTVIRSQLESGQWQEAEQLVRSLPSHVRNPVLNCWLSATELLSSTKLFRDHRLAVMQCPSESEQALLYAGIALGLKLRNSHKESTAAKSVVSGKILDEEFDKADETIKQAQLLADQGDSSAATSFLADALHQRGPIVELRDAFSRQAAATPEWWAEQAANCLETNDVAGLRTELWMQLAALHSHSGDKKTALQYARRARTNVVSAWCAVVFPNAKSRSGYSSSPARVNFRDERALIPAVNEILEDLLQIENIQRTAGDADAAQDTLLMAMKSVEIFPRNFYTSIGERPESPRGWMPKLAGHMQLRQHGDLAEIIFEGRCWSEGGNNEHRKNKNLVANMAGEAGDSAILENLLEYCHQQKTGLNRGEIDRLALCVETHLAILAARRGDAEGYRQKAIAVSGYLRTHPDWFPQGSFLPLVEPAVLLGKLDVAQEYLRQTQASSLQRDRGSAALAVALIQKGQTEEAKNLMREIRHSSALFRVQLALAHAEAKSNTDELWRIFIVIDKIPGNVDKAAAYAGIALKVIGK